MLKIEKLHYYKITILGHEELITPSEYAELYHDFMVMPEPEIKEDIPIDIDYIAMENTDEVKIYVPAVTETPETEPETHEPVVSEAPKRVPVSDLVPGVPAPKVKYKDDDFRKYIELGTNGMSRTEIVDRMILDMELGQSTAYRLYNKHVKNAVAYHKGVKERHDAISRIHREEIQSLPMYKSLKEFKNAVCERQHLNIYDVTALKKVYLESHEGVRW